MAVVSYEDVATGLGRPITDASEQAQVEMWIGDAEMLIRSELGDLAALDQDALAFVVREAVTSRLRNPEGVQYEAIDDYRYGMPSESRKITILPEWWRLLSPRGGRRAFSVMPS